jgi:hypothetical protein
MSQETTSVSPPRTALWLGGLGVLPFLVLTVAACVAAEWVAIAAIEAEIAYGAVILSFIAGVHWGFASHFMTDRKAGLAHILLGLSVLPSLVGWVALLLPTPWSAVLLGIAFAAILSLDRWALAISFAPSWWMRLRLPLSATVAILLCVTFAAALVRFGA